MADKGTSKLIFERLYLKSIENDLNEECEAVLKTTKITKPVKKAVCFPVYLQKFWI